MFDPRPLDSILTALEPGRDLGLRPGASEADVAGLPADLAALLRWHDGQDVEAATVVEQAAGQARLLVRLRSGIARRLRPQGRLLSAAEIKALARPGFVPVFEHPSAGRKRHVGLDVEGRLRFSFGPDGSDAVDGAVPGPRAEVGRGDLQAWLDGLTRAHRALYMIDLTPAERAQRWVLAVPGVLAQRWGAASDTFGMVPTPEHAWSTVVALRDDWGVDSAASATGVLAALRSRSREKAPAWNLARLVAIAGWSYRAGYLPLDVAWNEALTAARDLQTVHRGWFSMAEAYFVARDKDLGLVYDLRAREEALTELHATPWSPWNLLAWTTPLTPDVPPPAEPETPEVFVVHDGDTLTSALFDAPPRSLIRLQAGRYRGHFRARESGHVIEAVPGILPSAVVLEAIGAEPVLTITGGTRVRGVTIAPHAHGPGIQVEAPYLGLHDCFFAGGRSGLEVLPVHDPDADEPVVQLDRCFFEQPSDAAIVLSAGIALGKSLELIGAGGDAIRLDAMARSLVLEHSRIEHPARSGVAARDARVVLRRVHIGDAGQHGVNMAGGRLELDACEIVNAGGAGLRASAGAEVHAVGCRLADNGSANVELLGTRHALFDHCHLTGGHNLGAWLHPAHGTTFRGAQIGNSRGTCLVVEGPRGAGEHDVLLDGVGLGPSQGGALLITGGAQVHLVDATISGVAASAVEIVASGLSIDGLRVRNVPGHAFVVRDRARLEARRLECADVGDEALHLDSGACVIVRGLAIHGARRGLVARGASVALVHGLIISRCDHALHIGDGAHAAIAGDISLGDIRASAIEITEGGHLAVRSLRIDGNGGNGGNSGNGGNAGSGGNGGNGGNGGGRALALTQAILHLDGVVLRGRNALVSSGGRILMRRVTVGPDAMTLSDDTELIVDPTPPTVTAMSPFLVALRPECFSAWGMPGEVALLARVAGHLAESLGLGQRLALRESESGLTIEGPLPSIARLVPVLLALFVEAGALGLVLAEIALDRPR